MSAAPFAPRMRLTLYPECVHGRWFALVYSGERELGTLAEGIAFANDASVALVSAWHDWARRIRAQATG